YGGTDPTGIQTGLIWPYVKELKAYKCPADTRFAKVGGVSLPILRSVSMNSWLAGRSYGDPSGSWDWDSAYCKGGAGALTGLKYRLFLKDSMILKPTATFVLLDEDPVS